MKIILVALSLFFFAGTLIILYPIDKIYGIVTSYTQIQTSGNPKNSLPADANGDGKVDGKDYAILLQYYGKSGSGGAKIGDFNNDKQVNNIDLKIYLNYYTL
jgi:hypothetical protein